MIGGLIGGDVGFVQTVLPIIFIMVLMLLMPRLMAYQVIYRMKSALEDIKKSSLEAESMFLNSVSEAPTPEMKESLEPMKNFVVSPPASMDPAGLFQKLERVLDTSEEKMKGFVKSLNPDMSDEELADNSMAFKGVYGTHQIFVVLRHFKKLIEETRNFQLGGMMQMVLPVYKELAESQKDATKAFVNQVPIGDTIGPIVAAMLINDKESVEEAAEDIIVAEQSIDDSEYLVVKSNGPGARLGKYGDAVEKVVEDHDIEKIITVDAGMRYEGEETGTIVDGSGVMMGGPGVEKAKIEEVATKYELPLDGYIIKQSGPEASKPMHKKIWDSRKKAAGIIKDEIRNSDGKVLVIGVGNTCGAGNSKESIDGLEAKLIPYWKEQEEETASYFGLMKAFPMGNSFSNSQKDGTTFDLFQSIVRR